MTPAERDEVRGTAAMRACCEQGAGVLVSCGSDTCVMARAVLRYVPPGDAAAPHPWHVRHDGCDMVAITLDALVVAMEPDVARRLAHAIHAAADAAEEP